MLVYLIRHAKAHKESTSGQDFDRELTSRGVEQAAWLGQALAKHEHKPSVILSSPVIRALQTAQAIEAAVGCRLKVVEKLSTDHNAVQYALAMEDFALLPCIALVAHNPTLEQLAAGLLRGGNDEAPDFRTGQATLIELDVNDGSPGRLIETLRIDHKE